MELKAYNSFVKKGTNPNGDVSENKKIILVNNVILIALANTAPLVGVFYVVGNIPAAIALAIYVATVVVARILIVKNQPQFAKVLLASAGSMIVTFLSLSFGPEAKVDTYHITVMMLPFMFFSIKDLPYLILSILISFTCAGTNFIFYKKGITIGSQFLDPQSLNLLSYGLFFAALGSYSFLCCVLFYNNETVEISLKLKNKEVSNLLNNLRQGIFSVNSKLQIQPGFSSHTKEILGFSAIEGMSLVDVMNASELTPDKIEQIKTALMSSFGEDSIQFDINSHLLPKNFLMNSQKTLRVFWNPICLEDTKIESIMISVLDVTNEEHLKEESEKKSKKLQLVGKIISMGKDKSHMFEASARRYIADVRQALNKSLSTKDCKLAFRALHTIKGNSRTYNLGQIVNICHNAEALLQDYTKDKQDIHIIELMEYVKSLEKELNEYSDAIASIYSKQDDSEDLKKLINDLEIVYEQVDNSQPKIEALDQFIEKYRHVAAKPMELVISDQITAAKAIAVELGLREPVINVSSNNILLAKRFQEPMADILNHILRNSIDHGLSIHPKNIGHIIIDVNRSNNQIIVRISDSGPGLLINKIKEKAKILGVAVDNMSKGQIAELIFMPSLTTKEEVTTISGRGVGLDFVKTSVEKIGGNVKIELLPTNSDNQNQEATSRCKFALELSFPNYIATT